MLAEISNYLSIFWVIFSFSFLVALTGAMSPGPLLTYTIIKSARTPKHGYLMGLWVITGHAILEVGIILLLLLGFSFIFENQIVVRIIGVTGGIILVYFGADIIRDIRKGKISTDFFHSPSTENGEKQKEQTDSGVGSLENPVLGGVLVSMSNPYWWVWWATIGFAFMLQFEISFQSWPKLVAFFLGHEAGDLLWYMIVSVLSFFGLRRMNPKAYTAILAICSCFMILFGLYLGISPFLR